MGDPLNSAYDLLDSAEVFWRLGRYAEARQALDDAGPSPSRAVFALGNQIRAAMALSQRDFAGAMEFSRQVLDQPNVSIDLTVARKARWARSDSRQARVAKAWLRWPESRD